MTVLGPVGPSELGLVMLHEHLLHDDVEHPCWFQPPDDPTGVELSDGPVHMGVLGQLWRSPFCVRENCRLTRRDPIADEVRRFREAGGGTLVDVTSRGLAPDPEGLAAIARETGVTIVAGCGYYVDHVLPDNIADRSVEALAEELIRDLTVGIDGGPVRAGIIGEVGTSERITAREERSLRAAGQAAAATGAAVMVHLAYRGEQAFPAFACLVEEGVKPDRIVMNHIDEAADLDYARRVIDLGCLVEYDTFGSEWYYDTWGLWEPRDTDRVAAVAALCRDGLAGRITLAHDVFYKQSLRSFGGLGYDHIPRTIVPMLRAAGVGDGALQTMLVDTPRRILTLPGTGGRR